MFTDKTLQEVLKGQKRWEKEVGKAKRQKAEKGKGFSTVSDLEIKEIYTPEDIKNLDFAHDIGYPGIFPFTRGCQPTMYRGKEWTFRM
ncbi:MAG: methylmalonyl-CoA mutase family protein, partial [Dehalococcoidia bacterium]|nr:methylmalonyl-CoA mutase family protein [Dehalococcoidia bacterium]